MALGIARMDGQIVSSPSLPLTGLHRDALMSHFGVEPGPMAKEAEALSTVPTGRL